MKAKHRWLPVCTGCLRQLVTSPRFIVVMVITALYLDYTIAPIRAVMQQYGTRISVPGMLSFMMNDATASAFIALACLALMFDLPAVDELQRYLMLRTGRKSWARGQIAHCFCVALGYMIVFSLLSLVMILPYAQFSGDWSSGISALMEYESDSLLFYDTWIPRAYTPAGAWLLETLLHLLLLTMLGMLLMCVNLRVSRRMGFWFLSVPMGLDMLLEEYFSEQVNYFSPLTLCRLSGLDYGDGMGRPPAVFAVGILLAGTLLFSALFAFSVRRREVRL